MKLTKKQKRKCGLLLVGIGIIFGLLFLKDNPNSSQLLVITAGILYLGFAIYVRNGGFRKQKNYDLRKDSALGFFGFLGFNGFHAFAVHNPWYLFWFGFFAFLYYFKYFREELKYFSVLGIIGLIIAILGVTGLIAV